MISTKLPEGIPVFGGVRLKKGRFVSFLYIDDNVVGVKRGRTLMFKNGVYNEVRIQKVSTLLSIFLRFLTCSHFTIDGGVRWIH